MKKIAIFIICILLISSIYAAEIHRWKMDETSGSIAYDSVGGVHGTLANGAYFSDGAAHFDGVDDVININPTIRLHDTTNWTISINYKGTDTSGTGTYGTSLIGVNTGDWWGLITLVGGKVKFLHATSNGYHITWDNLIGTTNVADNDWHNIVIKNYSNATAEIFVDENLEVSGSSLMAGTPSQDVMSLRIEHFMLGVSSNYTSGAIKDIRIFDHAVTEDFMAAGNIPEPNSLILSIILLAGLNYFFMKIYR